MILLILNVYMYHVSRLKRRCSDQYQVWNCRGVSCFPEDAEHLVFKIKLHLFDSTVIPTAIYASETWSPPTKNISMFQQQCLWRIMKICILYSDHVQPKSATEKRHVWPSHHSRGKKTYTWMDTSFRRRPPNLQHGQEMDAIQNTTQDALVTHGGRLWILHEMKPKVEQGPEMMEGSCYLACEELSLSKRVSFICTTFN